MKTIVYDPNPMHGYRPFEDDVCETIRGVYGTGGGNAPIVLEMDEDDEKDLCGGRLQPNDTGRNALPAPLVRGGDEKPMVLVVEDEDNDLCGKEIFQVAERRDSGIPLGKVGELRGGGQRCW